MTNTPQKAPTTTASTLRSFPALAIDKAAYQQAIANSLHNPVDKAMVELFWHGTDDYQRFIVRDGFAAQQALLAQVRHGRAYYSKVSNDLKSLPTGQKDLAALGLSKEEVAALPAKVAAALHQVDMGTKADERLTLALMHYLERNGDTPQTLQPIVNITNQVNVEPTPITMEANINVAPAEVAVTLPARHTVSTIERNAAGEIIGSEQIEKSI